MKEIYEHWREFANQDKQPAEIAYTRATEFFTEEGLAGT